MQTYRTMVDTVAKAAIFFDEQTQAGNNREAENKNFLKVTGYQRARAKIPKREAGRLAELYTTPSVSDAGALTKTPRAILAPAL